MKCPLLFVGPGVPQGKSSESFSYLLDIYPTLCGMLGVTPPERVEGHDLSPIWRGEKKQVRDSIFLPYQSAQRSVRDDRWKLCVYPKINHRQLFDLKNDPHELNNLIDDPQHAKVRDRMLAKLQQWQTEMGDELPLSSEKPGAKFRDLTGVKRKPDRHQPEWIVEKYFEKTE